MSQAKRSRKQLTAHLVSWIFILLVGVAVGAVILVPRILGAVPLTVLTGSMMPNYRPGDIVVVQPTPVDELMVGDVITFQAISGNPELTTHRVVAIDRVGTQVVSVTTRGDANNVDDLSLIPDQIKGRVRYRVPLLGYLTQVRVLVPSIGLLVGLAFIAYSVHGITSYRRANGSTTGTELENSGLN